MGNELSETPAHILYTIYCKDELSVEEKTEEAIEKLSLLTKRKVKDMRGELKEFFELEKLFVRKSLMCCTYFGNENRTNANKYIKIDEEGADMSNNELFYRLLLQINKPNCVVAEVAGLFGTDKTEEYLREYARKNGICFAENNGRKEGKYVIELEQIRKYTASNEGHAIYECTELPI